MSDLAISGVQILDSWTEGDPHGQKHIVRKVRLTLTGQGTAANKIPASVLRLRSLVSSSPVVEADNSQVLPTCPDYEGENLLIGGGASNAPQDVTGVFDLTVRGTASY